MFTLGFVLQFVSQYIGFVNRSIIPAMARSLIAGRACFVLGLVGLLWLQSLLCAQEPNTGQTISLGFVGDIMAHDSNYNMQDFSRIYKRVRPLLGESDLNFANLEFVIDDARPYSTYPRFNVHTEYVLSAIEAGFQVFSLANNHSADFGRAGLRATMQSQERLRQGLPNIYFSGLRSNTQSTQQNTQKFETIRKNGWKIGFTAISILTNSPNGIEAVQYIHPDDRQTLQIFLRYLAAERPRYDLLIVSVHGGQEYQLEPSARKREILREIGRSGADIVWGHHPHVQQPWEIIRHSDSNEGDRPPNNWSLIMYSQGNFISAQTIRTKAGQPQGFWAATGDMVLLQVQLAKETAQQARLLRLRPRMLTTIRLKPFGFGVVPMRDAAQQIREQGYTGWDSFYAYRQNWLQARVAQWPRVP